MGRRPIPRQSYRKDGITVHRILTAIELDPKIKHEWKARIVPLLRSAVAALLEDGYQIDSKESAP